MPARAANGRFVKSPRKASSSTALAAPAPRSIARRSSSSISRSSPYAAASRRRRTGGGGTPPLKAGLVGAGLGVATTKFASVYNKLPEIGGTRMVAFAGLAHMGRKSVPHGKEIAEGSAYIAGWEVGKANASKLSLGDGGNNRDEF